MCGIVGYIGHRAAWPIVLAGLRRLEYRGYDSAGIAIGDAGERLSFHKTVGKVSGLAQESPADFSPAQTAGARSANNNSVGLGHTRWATHGKPSYANAHPHTDCHRRIAVAHNGIVENFLELKRRLVDSGHNFASETDTEVIPHLIEEGMAQGLSFEDAFRRVGGLVRGSQAITAIAFGPEPEASGADSACICALRLGHAGGVVVAHRSGEGMVGSDLAAVLPLLLPDAAGAAQQTPGEAVGGSELPEGWPRPEPVRRVGFLEAGEMAVVTRAGVKYLDLAGNPIDKQLRLVAPEDLLIDKGGYRHFMLKEIMEQPQAVASALRERVNFEAGRVELEPFPLSAAEVRRLQRVVLIGCGTSLHAAQVGRHLVERLAGLPAEAESASEYRYRDPYIDDRTLVISIGQSGETADTVAAMQMVREKGARLITICNVEGSQADRLAEGTLYMRSGIEIGVASTKTFIASLTILNLLAAYLGQLNGNLSPDRTRRLVDQLAQCPRLIGDMLASTTIYQQLARQLYTYNNILFLGRGINAPIALEGSLKLKEISYIHAEGYPAGEMKHGPIALIDQGMATVALAPQDSLYDKMVNNIKEVKARDGMVLAVVTEGDQELPSEVDRVLYIPQAPEHLAPMLSTIPLQLLAYHIAVQRGCDVDQPRNLAKSVTVE